MKSEEIIKERGYAKGLITKTITSLKAIPKKPDNVEQVKEKLNNLSELIIKFEEIHTRLYSQLHDEEEKTQAQEYRDLVIKDAQNYEEGLQSWIIGAESEMNSFETEEDNFEVAKDDIETETDNVAETIQTLEAEHEYLQGKLKDLQRKKQLEEELYAMKQKAMRDEFELKTIELENELKLKKAKKEMIEKQKQLELELNQMNNEETDDQHDSLSNPKPTSKLDRVSSPRQSHPMLTSSSLRDSIHPRRSAESWQPSQINSESMLKTILEESREQQRAIVETLQLPKRELQPFDGNPLKYWSFIRSFQANIGSKQVDPASKHSCLLHYCTGQARKVLEATEMMDPEEGYSKALQLLKCRFGNTENIAQEWIAKITERPDVKGASDLQHYADDLQCCQSMLKNMGHLNDLDNTFSLKIIWRKLPQYLRDKWCHEHYKLKKENKKGDLKHLVDFITQAAEEATDPVFSRLSYAKLKEASNKAKKGISSFTTTAQQTSRNIPQHLNPTRQDQTKQQQPQQQPRQQPQQQPHQQPQQQSDASYFVQAKPPLDDQEKLWNIENMNEGLICEAKPCDSALKVLNTNNIDTPHDKPVLPTDAGTNELLQEHFITTKSPRKQCSEQHQSPLEAVNSQHQLAAPADKVASDKEPLMICVDSLNASVSLKHQTAYDANELDRSEDDEDKAVVVHDAEDKSFCVEVDHAVTTLNTKPFEIPKPSELTEPAIRTVEMSINDPDAQETPLNPKRIENDDETDEAAILERSDDPERIENDEELIENVEATELKEMIGEHGRIKLPWIMGEEPTRRQKWKRSLKFDVNAGPPVSVPKQACELEESLVNFKKRKKQTTHRDKSGDLVLINQSDSPRNQWPLGLVVKAHTSADGLVRSVDIKTSSGVYERPVNKLCILEEA